MILQNRQNQYVMDNNLYSIKISLQYTNSFNSNQFEEIL